LNKVAIALGSNVGDRESHLAFALQRLAAFIANLRHSRWYDTAPVGVAPQPNFLNGAVTGETRLTARELLDALLAVERERGRVRPFEAAPRTLDLDLILYGSEVIDEPGLRVPHPRFRERAFVLEPLAEVAGGWTDPESGKTIGELWQGVRGTEVRTKN
jgi:2-amino-4-hydroxy-6-hydroxymethyldihydropteridine diphosphokinase